MEYNWIQRVDPAHLIAFARAWARLGRSTQEDLEDLLNQSEYHSFHPQSVRNIREQLGCYSPQIRETADEWLAAFEAANRTPHSMKVR